MWLDPEGLRLSWGCSLALRASVSWGPGTPPPPGDPPSAPARHSLTGHQQFQFYKWHPPARQGPQTRGKGRPGPPGDTLTHPRPSHMGQLLRRKKNPEKPPKLQRCLVPEALWPERSHSIQPSSALVTLLLFFKNLHNKSSMCLLGNFWGGKNPKIEDTLRDDLG